MIMYEHFYVVTDIHTHIHTHTHTHTHIHIHTRLGLINSLKGSYLKRPKCKPLGNFYFHKQIISKPLSRGFKVHPSIIHPFIHPLTYSFELWLASLEFTNSAFLNALNLSSFALLVAELGESAKAYRIETRLCCPFRKSTWRRWSTWFKSFMLKRMFDSYKVIRHCISNIYPASPLRPQYPLNLGYVS